MSLIICWSIIGTGDPKGVDLVLPECFQDNEISPIKTYFGGKEGTGKYTWYRTKEKLDNLEADLVASCSEVGVNLCVLLLISSSLLLLNGLG